MTGMHEILFNGKAINRDPNRQYRTDYKNGDWVCGLLSKFDEYGAEITNEEGVSGIDVDPETIVQFSGLNDKNGKRIFEGHICTDGENVYEVVFDRYQFSAKVIKTPLYLIKKGDIFPLWQFDNCERNAYRQLEIIGNIYDTPELLEAKNER